MTEPYTMFDPRWVVENWDVPESFGFNIPEWRGSGEVVLHRINNEGETTSLETVSSETFVGLLNEACEALGERLCLYFYSQPLDGRLLHTFPRVQNLQVSAFDFEHPEVVGELEHLKVFCHDVAFCDDAKRLEKIGVDRLKRLTLVETPDRKLDLSPLAGASELETLRLMGQYRNVAAIGALESLRELVLYPAKKLDLGFIEDMRGLEVLKFAVGAMESLESLKGHANLRDLSFEWVRFLSELGDLQRFPALERFRMSDQSRVEELVTGARNAALRHIWLGGTAKLEKIRGLGELPALESFFAHSTGLQLDQLDLPASLAYLQIVPKRMKERPAAEAAIRELGLRFEEHPDANFFYK
ncbi:hypothetical protein K3152_05360 [Qipengyuania sp. 1NDH17]|uniref:Leucine-rich repeat domain-containing protein n=1 Tax=Qipengyuania polymorpha TaxID=2867234 RepID=A0ABS7IVY7_9SPHN|nr:hypothetical protein [Qipengyuania polymorpha]MBX7457667.1 hypothetical protein [Qipengyuania polymorpha]